MGIKMYGAKLGYDTNQLKKEEQLLVRERTNMQCSFLDSAPIK
jgi:hypothetical protein